MKYRTIVADPPWAYVGGFGGCNAGGKGRFVRRPLPYESMTLTELEAVSVQTFADPNGANMFLWTTNRHLPIAFHLLQVWGANYRQTLIWHKLAANPLTGGIAPTTCEFLLFARFGKGAPLTDKLPDSLIERKRLANSHSVKPELFLDLVEQVSPGPYLELFARRQRLGWDTWGNEALEHVSLETS